MLSNNVINPVVVMLCCAAHGIVHAKNIDYTPDLASSSYWDSHYIAAVRVTAIHEDESAGYLTYQVETRISNEAIETVRNVPLSHLWFGKNQEGAPQISVEDRFVIFYSREGLSPTVFTPLSPGEVGSRVVDTLRRIGQLRENPGDLQSYLKVVLETNPTVARYSLHYLLSQRATLQANADYVARLIQFRNDESRETRDRILAGRLANRLEGTGEGNHDTSDAEYSWLQTSLAASQIEEWTELTPFVDRLLEYENKRTETAEFLIQLASGPAIAPPVRIAAYGALPDPRLFNFDQPDSESVRIYQACIRMLSDPEPTMRRAAAALLHNITMRVNSTDKPAYVLTSNKAITEALSLESDELARFHLNHFLKLLAY